jgi:hypothetical protein
LWQVIFNAGTKENWASTIHLAHQYRAVLA